MNDGSQTTIGPGMSYTIPPGHDAWVELTFHRKRGDECDAGEDYTALAKKFPTPPASAGIIFDGDEGRLSEEAFLRDFAQDVPEAKARALYAVQWPFHKELLTGKTTQAAWRPKPSWYAVSTEDRTINPDLERFMAKRMGAKTIEVKASHVSLISQPETIANLILDAAVQQKS
jgi:pimeloyl-ACP methyl ester carboxylesterase